MAKFTYNLNEVKPGDFICWTICSQNYFTATVTILDNSVTYATVHKTCYSTDLTMLGQGSHIYTGGAMLRVEIDIPQSTRIDVSPNSFPIQDKKMNNQGHGYNLCVEDWTDMDYNDIYVNFVAWHSKG